MRQTKKRAKPPKDTRPLHKRKRVHFSGAFVALIAVTVIVLALNVVSFPGVHGLVAQKIEEQLPEGYAADFQKAGLTLREGWIPALNLNKLRVWHEQSGAQFVAENVDLRWFMPAWLSGRPAIEVEVREPHVQLVQDFNGVNLANLEFDEESVGDTPTVRLQVGSQSGLNVTVGDEGLSLRSGDEALKVKSDNAWAIEAVNGLEGLLALFAENTADGAYRKLTVSGGRIDVLDRIYQLYRSLDYVELELLAYDNGVSMFSRFSAAGRRTSGSFFWTMEAGQERRVSGSFENLDLALLMPFLDDQDGVFALKGGSKLDFDVNFDDKGVYLGQFDVDVSGTLAAVESDVFPVQSEVAQVEWKPRESRYFLSPTRIEVGQSYADISGEFALGLDELYGPTVGIGMQLANVYLHPNDMDAPEKVIPNILFNGWSAPVYGAIGIDKVTINTGEYSLQADGRVDVLQAGIGLDLAMVARGMDADSLKRLWPYFLAREAREWFVENVSDGRLNTAKMRFDFPVGTIGEKGEDKPIPKDGLTILGTAQDVSLLPLPGFPTIDIVGTTTIKVKDHFIEMGFDRGLVSDAAGQVEITNAAYLNRNTFPKDQVFEISGDLEGDVSTLIAIASKEPLNLLEDFDLEYKPEDLTGAADINVIATISQFGDGKPEGLDYTLNGSVQDFASDVPIEGYAVSEGDLQFTASQEGYQASGRVRVDDVLADLRIEAEDESDPVITASATLTEKERKKLGFDVSQFVTGPIRVVGRPVGDDIQVAVDLTNAALKFSELGVSKKAGVAGQLNAELRLAEDHVDVPQIDLRFGNVRIAGGLEYDFEDGLTNAEMSTFQLNPGDKARVSLSPVKGGFKVNLSGEQLDLKPMLRRFLGLDQGTSAATSNAEDQIIDIDISLDRALGFYKTTAFNTKGRFVFRGADFRTVNMQSSFGNDKSVSITTNPLQSGRSMVAASNDLGTLLRFIGIYPRLLNGVGSLVLNINDKAGRISGGFTLNEFAIADEEKVALVLGNHRDSRKLIERQNQLRFRKAEIEFTGGDGVITVTKGALDGGTIGGTLRGNIYTGSRQYDLVGTYIPLFGLNNIFQKLPLLGAILGGRDGEGLIGVTFAVRGPLDDPQFSINPASILAPGVFRQIFEFKAKGDPEAERALEQVQN
ncbi:AsmA-like protein [Maritalea mobilis]|uniref:AsmA-like protein n=1 Tax=Maritalea mobilis TaxID=483324 RepID=A0A4R6VUN9_9HYPH|nr:AsmA-like C-terminal domain-containing protein [Maritalea mobilis]TDQ66424.1 AsmA-like protein [Maritalea mobilis]